MGGIGRTGFFQQCTYVPIAANLAVCSVIDSVTISHLGPPLSVCGPRLAILKYQGSDPTQPYPTFVVPTERHASLRLCARGKIDVVRALRMDG